MNYLPLQWHSGAEICEWEFGLHKTTFRLSLYRVPKSPNWTVNEDFWNRVGSQDLWYTCTRRKVVICGSQRCPPLLQSWHGHGLHAPGPPDPCKAKTRQNKWMNLPFSSAEWAKRDHRIFSRFFNRMLISAFTLQAWRTIMHLFFTSSCIPTMEDTSGLSAKEWTRKTNNPSEGSQQPQRERSGRKKSKSH